MDLGGHHSSQMFNRRANPRSTDEHTQVCLAVERFIATRVTVTYTQLMPTSIELKFYELYTMKLTHNAGDVFTHRLVCFFLVIISMYIVINCIFMSDNIGVSNDNYDACTFDN